MIVLFKFFSIKTNLPVFKIKESSVRRRFSDFEWLRNELEKGSKVILKKSSVFLNQFYLIDSNIMMII